MDVESHNDDESKALGCTSIWLGSYIDENSKVDDEDSYFYSIEEWLDRLEDETKIRRKNNKRSCANLCIYIYNLSFEWSFILPKLLERGFKYNPDIKETSEFVYNSVSTKTCSSVYCVNLKFGKNHGKILLKDLAKIFGGGLGKVAKSFGISTQKGEIDYTLNRLHNYVITKEEKEYCFKDTRILMEILIEMDKKKDKMFWNSISMASYSMKVLITSTWRNHYRPLKAFRKIYPRLSREENNFIRKSIEGGLTYSPPRWQYVNIEAPVLHIDAHQMYPSQMYYNLYPYGEGEYFEGKPKDISKISCCHVRISYDDALLQSKVQLIGYRGITDYEIYVWDFEIELMKKIYVNLKIEYIDGYAYKRKLLSFRQYYKRNYELRKEAKAKKNDFNILYYKLLNNASYGKFIEKYHEFEFQNVILPNGMIDSIPIPKDNDYLAKYTYCPIGSCTTAYARCCLINNALKFGYEKVLYFDTDSIFVLYDEETKKIWETQFDKEDHLGGWGLEEINQKAQFTAPKRYKLYTEDDKTIVKAGGINFKYYLKANNMEEMDYRETNIESSEWMVQRAYRVRGGTIIDFQKKDISIPKKYEETYKENKGKVYS